MSKQVTKPIKTEKINVFIVLGSMTSVNLAAPGTSVPTWIC
jgi:hypothetical protein